MASLLRSGKFLRLFSSNISRNFDLNNGGCNSRESLLSARRSEWEIKPHRSLSAVQLPVKNLNDSTSSSPHSEVSSVDRALTKVDLDVQKLGRVSRKDIESIVEEINTLKTISSSQSLLLIRCCGNLVPEEHPKERTKLVQDVWNMLLNMGVKLDISHYNALLRVYLENEYNLDPMKFLKMLEEKKIEPNRVTYQRLLTIYCQKGDISGASQILEMMKSKNLPIGELVFNSLVMGHSNTGDMESAKGVIKVMSQAGLEPDGETYRALLSGYAKQGKLQELTDTMAECEKKEVSLHHRDVLEVLFSAAVHGQSAVVDYLLSRMPKTSGYNQDCVNVILRLVNYQKEDEAFKVLMTMKPGLLMDGQTASTGNFFIRQIVKAKCSPEKIVSFCQRLVDAGLNSRAYFRALESSNALEDAELSTLLLRKIQDQKESLRPSMFWPLLTAQSKVKGEKGVLDVLKQMTSMRLYPNLSTMNQYVLPYMENVNNSREVLKKLRSADVPISMGVVSLLIEHLNRRDFTAAIALLRNNYIVLESKSFGRALADAYLKTSDAKSVVKVIQTILQGADPETPADASVTKSRTAELVCPIVREIFDMAPRPKVVALEPLLQALQEQGMGLSQSTAQFIQEALGDDMTDSVAELLTELSSGKLTPLDVQPGLPRRRIFTNNTQDNKQLRFIELARERKLDEALALKREMEAANIAPSDAMNVMLMELYSYHNRLDDALTVFDQLAAQTPEIKILPSKLLNFAYNLLKVDRIEDVHKVLRKLTKASETGSETPGLDPYAWRLLNAAAEKEDVDLTQKLFERIEEAQIVPVRNILGPLVKVHLVKDDIEGAMKVFTNCAEKYQVTPMKNKLTSKFIESENAQALQQLMDISIKVHGEMNSLYDLVFSFLECGRVRQAKKVLETPGLRARTDRLELACKRYVEEKRITELENLIKITRDVFGVDRAMMFNHLLTACIETGDDKRAVGIWTMMQEEDLQPSDDFLRKLGKFLVEKDQPVPFAIPEETVSLVDATPTPATKEPSEKTRPQARRSQKSAAQPKPTTSASQPVSPIKELIQKGDIDSALALKQKLETDGAGPSSTDNSLLIEALVQKGKLDEASTIVKGMLEKGKVPMSRVFRFYISRLPENRVLDTLLSIEQYLSEDVKRTINFENRVATALSSDPAATSKYLDDHLTSLKKSSEPNATSKKIPLGGILAILKNNPGMQDKCKELAEEYVKAGVYTPLNAMWCHYMMSGQKEAAKSAWSVLQNTKEMIRFSPINRHARAQADPALAEELAKTLSTSSFVKTSAVALAYSAWVDILNQKNSLDEAVAVLNKALDQGIPLNEINNTSLTGLKKSFDAAGREFPFSIPPKSSSAPTQLSGTEAAQQ